MPKISFQKAFAGSMEDARHARLGSALMLALHPSSHAIQFLSHPSMRAYPNSPAFEAWMRPDHPWLGAALWSHPASLDSDMTQAGCGAIFSHGYATPSEDQAYIQHLGPQGSQVSGCHWNPKAFASEDWGMDFLVGSYETRFGRLDPSLAEGRARPSHWPEPLPMVRRIWREDDPPELSPDLAAVALLFAIQTRASVAKAIMEETDATPTQVELLLGGCAAVPGSVARHFARQEHAMFGASPLSSEHRIEAGRAVGIAQHAWALAERAELAKATSPARGEPARSPRI